jgi:rsbT co-antagonist protein RsbR
VPENKSATSPSSVLPAVLAERRAEILENWVRDQTESATMRPDLISATELRQQSDRLLTAVRTALQSGTLDLEAAQWSAARDLLRELSVTRATQGFSVSETATFVLSLKSPILAQLRQAVPSDAERLANEFLAATKLIDELSLYTVRTFVETREGVIRRQQQEMMELSTPVVQLFDGVLALPLIGTLDSARTQVVMENLLQEIVRSGASIAILDITGVPTVDTLVAQHLLKTVAAARLMGADCIISGIRPQIAQTIVHLGVELQNVTTKATLADALRVAMRRLGHSVVEKRTPAGQES